MDEIIKLIKKKEVLAAGGFSPTGLYRHMAQGLWPSPVRLGVGRAVGWPANEVAAVNKAKIAGKSGEEIKQLVKELEAARKN